MQAAALAAREGEAAELARRLARAEAAPAELPASGTRCATTDPVCEGSIYIAMVMP